MITNEKREASYETPLPSAIGKDIIRNIKDKYRTHTETVISFKDGDKVIDIKTTNIQQLVKRFAHRIFEESKIDVAEGK